MMGKVVLITGATSGIGEACAQRFAKESCDLILTGRRKEKLEKLKDTLEQTFSIRVFPLAFDIRNKEEVTESISRLNGVWTKIDILINNAGLSQGLDAIQDGNTTDWDTMIDTNLKGLLYITHAVIPLMMENGRGHIINIGSIAGKEVYPRGNVYCATKHAVDALTKSMRMDLMSKNIKVTQVAPGAVKTEFSIVRFKGDEEKAARVYEGYTPLKAADIAEITYYATTLPDHVNINDVVVMPMAQANATIFYKT